MERRVAIQTLETALRVAKSNRRFTADEKTRFEHAARVLLDFCEPCACEEQKAESTANTTANTTAGAPEAGSRKTSGKKTAKKAAKKKAAKKKSAKKG